MHALGLERVVEVKQLLELLLELYLLLGQLPQLVVLLLQQPLLLLLTRELDHLFRLDVLVRPQLVLKPTQQQSQTGK